MGGGGRDPHPPWDHSKDWIAVHEKSIHRVKITFTISMGTLECVASVSVWFRSKERPRNGILCFGRAKNDPPLPLLFYLPHFSRCLWLWFFVPCFETHRNACYTGYGHTKYHLNINFLYHQILSKISAAWQWTVCRRVGLFAADQKVDSPLAVFSDNKSPPTAPNVSPHDIWIKFLARRFEVIKYYSRDQVRWQVTTSFFVVFCPES